MKSTAIVKNFAVVFTFVASPAWADGYYMAGNKILETCQDSGGNLNFGLCLGFITGVHDGAKSAAAMFDISPIFCVPSEVTPIQMRDVLVKYLEENPGQRHLTASGNAIIAFSEAFPCQ